MSRFALDPDEWVLYQADVYHVCTKRDPRRALKLVMEFLNAQESVKLNSTLELFCERAYSTKTRSRFAEARERLGAASAGGTVAIDIGKLDEAIAFGFDGDKYPREMVAPACVTFAYDFLWPDFRPRVALPNEQRKPTSRLIIRVGDLSLRLGPQLVFPAPWTTEIVRDYITQVESKIPVKIYDRYFKRWLPGRDGKDPRTVKLKRDWRQPSTGPVTNVAPPTGGTRIKSSSSLARRRRHAPAPLLRAFIDLFKRRR